MSAGAGEAAAPLGERLLAAAPLVLTAAYLGQVAHLPLVGGALALLLVLTSLVGPRLRLGVVERALLAALSVGVMLLWDRLLLPEEDTMPADTLPRPWLAMAAYALLAAATRQITRAPAGGALAQSGYGLIALGACGQTRALVPFGILMTLHLGLLLLSHRSTERDRPAWARLPGALRRAALLVVATSGLLAGLLTLPLKPTSGWLQGHLLPSYFGSEQTRVGFSEHLRLGDLQRVLESNRPVLRLRGPRSDYLRGGVYSRYQHNLWSGEARAVTPAAPGATPAAAPRPRHRVVTVARGPLQGAGAVEAEVLTGAARHQEPFFAPLGLRALATRSGDIQVAPLGVLERNGERLWWIPTALEEPEDLGAGRVVPLEPPGPEDLQLPRDSAAALRALAAGFVGDAREGDVGLRLARIEQRLLSDYRYSLRFQRRSGKDPLLEFLTRDKQGHCEYFAAAMTLLARAAGVPARLVGGYRVAEENSLGGYYLVRERNAHAWSEAFVPGRGWQTWDATPASGVPDNQPHRSPWLAALSDYAQVLAGRAWAWLLAQSPLRIGAPLTLVVLLGLWVRWRQRRRLRRSDGGTVERHLPLPAFAVLEAALGARGLARPAHEPLEVYAERLRGGSLGTRGEEAAALVTRYAALRYGTSWERRDEEALSADLVSLSAALR